MNRYILLRRLRGPAILLLIGVLALLHQLGVIDHFWHYLVPLMLILLGVLLLAERAVLATDSSLSQGYPGSPYPGASAAQPPVAESTSIVPAHSHDFGDDSNGGQQ